MIGLVLVTHGRLAEEFVAATEHVVGPQEGVRAISIGADDDMEQRRKDILEGAGVGDRSRRESGARGPGPHMPRHNCRRNSPAYT